MNSKATQTPAEAPTVTLRTAKAHPPTRATESLALAGLRNRLVQEELNLTSAEPLKRLIGLVAVEAEAHARSTQFPLLLFPGLFEEKARMARRYVARQRTLWQRSGAKDLPKGLRKGSTPDTAKVAKRLPNILTRPDGCALEVPRQAAHTP